MPLLLPVVLCVLGIGVSCLPPADVRPVEQDGRSSGNWLPMALAAILVLVVSATALHRLSYDEPHRAELAARSPR
jgi:hypothetical protein